MVFLKKDARELLRKTVVVVLLKKVAIDFSREINNLRKNHLVIDDSRLVSIPYWYAFKRYPSY